METKIFEDLGTFVPLNGLSMIICLRLIATVDFLKALDLKKINIQKNQENYFLHGCRLTHIFLKISKFLVTEGNYAHCGVLSAKPSIGFRFVSYLLKI